MANLNQVFARNVRRLRREQGLSQERLGELSGRHRTYVGAVERGEANVTLDVVEAIAGALGTNPLDLLRASSRS